MNTSVNGFNNFIYTQLLNTTNNTNTNTNNNNNNNTNANTSLDINAPINLSSISVMLAPITLQD